MAHVVARRLRRRLARTRVARAQRGSALIEVLIGTLLLGLATTAVLGGLDGAQDAGLRNKNRSVAATLAQQDLERLRSLPPTVLANYEEARTVTVGGVGYTVASRTDWVVDASGLLSCTSEETEAEYLKLKSTVTAPADPDAPVTAESLLAPAPGTFADETGTAAVKLTDRDGAPLAGVAVSLIGATTVSGTTNELGCAIFGFVGAGTWTAQVGGSLVGWDGVAPAQSPVTVAEGKTSLTQIELDTAASLRALFETPSEVPALWHSIAVVNAKLPSGVRHFADATATTSKDADSLFPFNDGYGVYATACEDDGGEPLCCEANNPAAWDADYFQESGKGYVELDPGELLKPVAVVVPTLHVTVTRSGGATFASARVTVTQRNSGYDSEPGSNECSSTIVDTTATGPSETTAYEFDIPVPFGDYRVCATYGGKRKRTGSSGAPDDPALTGDPLEPAVALAIPTSGGSGSCP
jgi:Tfp pilus assembly protein PilV